MMASKESINNKDKGIEAIFNDTARSSFKKMFKEELANEKNKQFNTVDKLEKGTMAAWSDYHSDKQLSIKISPMANFI